MKVKICGIRDIETAHFALSCGADAIGFVFARSKRQITIKEAAEIAKQLPKDAEKVGVFVNEDITVVQEIANQVGLTIVQLHGEESPEYAKKVGLPIIKAFGYDETISEDTIIHYPARYYLLDRPKGVYQGGNGESFDWSLLIHTKIPKDKMILAGGLHPKNVQTAINLVRPMGVDVSSGVETNGTKDQIKIKQFIELAKGENNNEHLRTTR